ncbi:hypothetical protein [Chitinophaga sp. RAB17]|uniref:hypothetical protein n=1 Tax=Chitinophaga sp. RAB17 TaxID=3233049 RepID=UPI003F92C098
MKWILSRIAAIESLKDTQLNFVKYSDLVNFNALWDTMEEISNKKFARKQIPARNIGMSGFVTDADLNLFHVSGTNSQITRTFYDVATLDGALYPQQNLRKEDNGDDGYYLYETASSDKISSGIVKGKSAIAYFGITKTAFEKNGSVPGRYDAKHERVKNLITIHGKANRYIIKGAETAIIELNSKGSDIKYTTRVDNKSRSTSDRARINAGIKWLRANFGNDWTKKFLRPENPKGPNHPDSNKNKIP